MTHLQCNMHTHTTFSDGQNSPEEMARTAEALNMRTLGFTDHIFTPGYENETLPRDMSGYVDRISALAEEYSGRLEIVCGLEEEFAVWADAPGVRYRIGSRHSIWRDGYQFLIDNTPEEFGEGVDRLYGGDVRAAVTDYYRLLCSDVQEHVPEIMGHLDLVRKFNTAGRFFDEDSAWYRAAALEAAQAAGEKGVIFEINTANIARKRRNIFYPADFVLKYILEHGWPVMVNSDAHYAGMLTGAFGLARRRLLDIGFRSVAVWENGGFTECAL